MTVCQNKDAIVLCTRCASHATVTTTRLPAHLGAIFPVCVRRIPTFKWRRRKCDNPECRYRMITYEIDAKDLQQLLADVARLAAQTSEAV